MLVLGSGSLWQYFDYENKKYAAALEHIKVQKDLYARQLAIQHGVSSELVRYIELRDAHLANSQDYSIQISFNVLKSKLATSIGEYNRLAITLARLEGGGKVRWFVLAVPPTAPQNLRAQQNPDGTHTLIADYVPDPLATMVEQDVKGLIDQYDIKVLSPTPSLRPGTSSSESAQR